MALLTAEDVLNKAFSKTRYREGFDQDEVDDFLDEVAHTISTLASEREDLERKLQDAASAPAPAAPAAEPAPAPAEPEPAAPAAMDPAAMLGGDSSQGAAGMFALASKLHDEFVKAGEEEKEQILADATREKDRLLSEATQESERLRTEASQEKDKMLADAKATAADEIAQRKAELSRLETKIEDLKAFERDYRSRLRQFLQNLQSDLEADASPEPGEAQPSAQEWNAADDDADDSGYTPRWGGEA